MVWPGGQRRCATLQRNQRCGSVCVTWSKHWVIHSVILCRTAAQLKETDTPVTTLAADCVTFTIRLSLLPVLCPRNAPIKVSPLWLSTCALEDTAARRGSALACRPKGNQDGIALRRKEKKKKQRFHFRKEKKKWTNLKVCLSELHYDIEQSSLFKNKQSKLARRQTLRVHSVFGVPLMPAGVSRK